MLSFYIAIFVQVVLESLPVSSSGHILLLEHCLHQKYSKELMYLLHIPTLLIVLLFFYKPLLLCIEKHKKNVLFFLKLLFLIGFIESLTVLFFIFFNFSYGKILAEAPLALVIGLGVTAGLLYSLRWAPKKNNDAMTLTRATIIGIAQGCALLPGISRFAAVYASCSWIGMSRVQAFYITWLVQVPLIVAAVGKTIVFKNISQELIILTESASLLIIAIASVGGYYALAKSYTWVLRGRLWICAYYMIVPLFLALICFLYTLV